MLEETTIIKESETAVKAISTFNELELLISLGHAMTGNQEQETEVIKKVGFMYHLVRKGEIGDRLEIRKVEKALSAIEQIKKLTEDKKESLKAELEYIDINLPNKLDKEVVDRLGLAGKIWIAELIVSNIAEFGLDGILYMLIQNPNIPPEVKSAFGGFIAISLSNIVLPLPIPSTAGVTRTFMHIFSTPYFINKFNRNRGENSNIKPTFRLDHLALMFEGMGITLLPFLTILRCFGLDLSFGAVKLLLNLKSIKEVEEMYDLRQL